MKYIKLEVNYSSVPLSKNNLKKAFKELGRIDPLCIKKYTLKRTHRDKKVDFEHLNDKQLISRGILNVRKSLNGNLGSHGKFSNRMIRKTSEIKEHKTQDNKTYLITQLPYKDYLKITLHTYFLLYQYNKEYCKKLLEIENNDNYEFQSYNKSVATKTITPIQTNIVIRSKCDEQIKKEFVAFIKSVIS